MLLHRMPQVMNFDERVTIFATTLGQHVNEKIQVDIVKKLLKESKTLAR